MQRLRLVGESKYMYDASLPSLGVLRKEISHNLVEVFVMWSPVNIRLVGLQQRWPQ
jgi:hypothetical protein